MDQTQFKFFLRFLKFILPYRGKWLAILGLSGLAALLGLINPYLTKLVVDDAIGHKDLKTLVILVLIGGGVFILVGSMNALKSYFDRYIKLKVNYDLNKKIFEHMQNFSLGWFQGKSTGENLYKISEDVGRVTDFVTTTPPQAVFIFPKLLLTLAVVFYLNWKMALFSLCLAPFLYLPPYYFSRKMKKVWQALIENYQHIYDHLQEAFSHIQVIKAFGKETASMRRYLNLLADNVRIGMKNLRLDIFHSFTVETVSKVIIGLITFYGGYQVIKGRLTLGGLAAVMVYLRQLTNLQGEFAGFFQTAVLGSVSCQRVAETLDQKADIVEARNAKKVIFKRGEISFENVTFGYRAGEPVVKDLTFRIENESHIALVGPSGCGKTTIALLILRLYDPGGGRIFVDGHDIRGLKSDVFKAQVGVVLQEPLLWNDSIENNIKYAREDATREEIERVARMTGVAEFAEALPQGYETVIGENACRLSEGQKQKIAIARALIKRPKILILDEAMSSMDSVSEEKISSNIKQYQPKTTLITVSHRFNTVMRADLVYFLRSPEEILIGKPQKLLEDNSDFCYLFADQITPKPVPLFDPSRPIYPEITT